MAGEGTVRWFEAQRSRTRALAVTLEGQGLTKEQWTALPASVRAEITKDAMAFKAHLRDLSSPGFSRVLLDRIFSTTFFVDTTRASMGMDVLGAREDERVRTPILNGAMLGNMADFVAAFEAAVRGGTSFNGSPVNIPPSLVQTELGLQILNDLKTTQFSRYVFCHNALNYTSFVVTDGKLTGIVNWQYSGLYPPEVEDIIAKYMDEI